MFRQNILLYVTTHLSMTHTHFLQQCWHDMYTNLNNHANINVHLYITNNSTTYNPKLLSIPHTFTQIANPGYQNGAIAALYDPSMQRMFKKYDWVIRVNPDVIIYTMHKLVHIMKIQHVYGIFANCNLRETSTLKRFFPYLPFRSYPDNCVSGCVHRRIMTDFIAFRGNVSLSNKPHLTNAEDDATILFSQITQSRTDRWIYPYNLDNSCRIRFYDTIVHEHDTSRCTTFNK